MNDTPTSSSDYGCANASNGWLTSIRTNHAKTSHTSPCLSSFTTEGAVETMKAFDLGAFDVLSKPPSRTDKKLNDFSEI